MKRLFGYLLGKRSEIADLEAKDAVLAKVVLDIHRKRTETKASCVPLFALHQVHALDRDNVIAATAKRVEVLQANAVALRKQQTLTHDVLASVLPSVSWVKVVAEEPDRYIAFEGNGRIAALQTVFAPEDGIEVEVEVYGFRNPAKIVRRLNRVRRMNGLIDD